MIDYLESDLKPAKMHNLYVCNTDDQELQFRYQAHMEDKRGTKTKRRRQTVQKHTRYVLTCKTYGHVQSQMFPNFLNITKENSMSSI